MLVPLTPRVSRWTQDAIPLFPSHWGQIPALGNVSSTKPPVQPHRSLGMGHCCSYCVWDLSPSDSFSVKSVEVSISCQCPVKTRAFMFLPRQCASSVFHTASKSQSCLAACQELFHSPSYIPTSPKCQSLWCCACISLGPRIAVISDLCFSKP